jgi:mannose-1-phosphate guanylyltransferase/mannose-6-phosphate isomerase
MLIFLITLFFLPLLHASEEKIYVVLLAGGGGTRLWPASTDAFPKQFLDFGTGESLLQKTIQRLLRFEHIDEIAIATNADYESLVRAQIEKFKGQTQISILVEPSRKNTAPAIAYAVRYFSDKIDSDAPILVVPADHLISPELDWVHAVEEILPTVAKGQIVTFGIQPTGPQTGFGYLELGAPFDAATFELNRFIEKPNLETAQKLIESDRVFWNAGIFAFSPKTFWSEMQKHCPEIYHLSSVSLEEMQWNFSQMPDLSIDYALMEKTKQIVASPLQIIWSDIGSWDGLYEVLDKDENGNVVRGKVVGIDTKNSLLFSTGDRLIATIGLEDLIIVETQDVLLICKREESQKIKALLQKLKSQEAIAK